MLLYTERLLHEAAMNTEIDLSADEHSEVRFSSELDGNVLQLAGNSCEIAIRLDDRHLQDIVNQLAEWGWTAT